MAAFEIKINKIDEIRAALAKYSENSSVYLSRAINASLVILVKTTGKDSVFKFKAARGERSGLLALSFGQGRKLSTPSDLTGSVGPTVDYAKYVEFGTAAHIIQAINKKVLANRKKGLIFGKVVHHPGTAANPFMERIIEASSPEINQTFDRALQLILDSVKV